MKLVFDYRLKAADSAANAAQEADAKRRKALLREAAQWIALADNEEWLHHNSLSVVSPGPTES